MAIQKSIMDTFPDQQALKLEDLYIPVRYQRALEGSSSARIIEHIKQNFNWGECGAILVCKLKKDDKKYAVVDGQHRFRGAELRDDIDKIPCVIISPRDMKEQAQTFININTRRSSLNQLQLHKASLVAGDPLAVEMQRICDEGGVKIPLYQGPSYQAEPDSLQAIARIRQMLSAADAPESLADNIIWTFKMIRSAYPKTKGAMRFNLIRALIRWIQKYPATRKDDIVQTLRTIDLNEIDLDARRKRMAGEKTLWKAYLSILEEEFHKLHKKKAA